MFNNYFLYALLLGMMIFNCSGNKSNTDDDILLALTWKHEKNAIGNLAGKGEIQITNKGAVPLPSNQWAIYFNQITGPIPEPSSLKGLQLSNVVGELYKLAPDPTFSGLPAGEKKVFPYASTEGVTFNYSAVPQGAFLVYTDENGVEKTTPVQITIHPFKRKEQFQLSPNDNKPLPDAFWRFDQQASVTLLSAETLPLILPTPLSTTLRGNSFPLSGNTKIIAEKGLENEKEYIRKFLDPLFTKSGGTNNSISLKIENFAAQEKPGAYQLDIQKGQITIVGKDAQGVFYGIQSLIHLLPANAFSKKNNAISLPGLLVNDAPRYEYRGFHLDVGRNFHSKETILHLLDILAHYKMNTFHFHLTDDEGWRIEIPGLPELTAFGSKRGYSKNEKSFLQPSYGSGLLPDAGKSSGTGFYTRNDFIEILKYARERHIQVIPEVDIPGHARAAIKSMEARQARLQLDGNKSAAEQYRLFTPNDNSSYRSVQNYPDNVLDVCKESTYTFIGKIFDEIRNMYQDAGVPLKTMHVGGDEVPEGVWKGSPSCLDLLTQLPQGNPKDILTQYFLTRLDKMLDERGIQLAGWEEVALIRIPKKPNGFRYEPNPTFSKDGFLAYVWNSLGESVNLSYRLANAGYDVVLSNVTNLYFDLAYDGHPAEPGLIWGGYVDTKTAWRFSPNNQFAAVLKDNQGNDMPISQWENTMDWLKPEGKKHIKGIQGQLWTETVKTRDMVFYYTLPKLLGLAERAWTREPAWEAKRNSPEREQLLNADWEIFANKLGQKELAKLDYIFGGYTYRVPPPGAKIIDAKVTINTPFPGLQVRFTLNGKEPDANSQVYSAPIPLKKGTKLKFATFTTSGRKSRTVTLPANEGELTD
jgi:hexosaminidase